MARLYNAKVSSCTDFYCVGYTTFAQYLSAAGIETFNSGGTACQPSDADAFVDLQTILNTHGLNDTGKQKQRERYPNFIFNTTEKFFVMLDTNIYPKTYHLFIGCVSLPYYEDNKQITVVLPGTVPNFTKEIASRTRDAMSDKLIIARGVSGIRTYGSGTSYPNIPTEPDSGKAKTDFDNNVTPLRAIALVCGGGGSGATGAAAVGGSGAGGGGGACTARVIPLTGQLRAFLNTGGAAPSSSATDGTAGGTAELQLSSSGSWYNLVSCAGGGGGKYGNTGGAGGRTMTCSTDTWPVFTNGAEFSGRWGGDGGDSGGNSGKPTTKQSDTTLTTCRYSSGYTQSKTFTGTIGGTNSSGWGGAGGASFLSNGANYLTSGPGYGAGGAGSGYKIGGQAAGSGHDGCVILYY